MGRYDEVSKFISSLNGELASKLAFEEAYSLYRLFKVSPVIGGGDDFGSVFGDV